MADIATSADSKSGENRSKGLRAALEDPTIATRIFWTLLGVAVLLVVLRPWLPAGLIRIPESLLLPWRDWIDAAFQLFAFDLGFIHVTRFLSGILEFVLDAVANVLYGRARWPRFEAIPWTVIASIAAVLGYALGGWRLSLP